ncbi:MAG: class I SAM-dependent RNA methyltransferase, partial [Clostridia bacterium]|nr:class I SAM-dependent RNA methyltransferase [Clostridia bacterium]
MRFVATCLFGLEKFLGEEIDALGYKRLETMDGRVIFEGGPEAVARANMWLRTAERVFVLLGRFPAPTFDALFEGTKALPLEEWIGAKD